MQGDDGMLQLFDGLALRPQRPGDEPFLRRLIHHSKAELCVGGGADKPKDEIHAILDQQVAAQRAWRAPPWCTSMLRIGLRGRALRWAESLRAGVTAPRRYSTLLVHV